MWTRSELKQNAKAVLKGSYWESVAVIIICGAISAVGAFMGGVIATLFLSLPLTVGMNFFFMQNQITPPAIRNVFFPFEGGRYLKIIGSMAWMYLFITLWSLISMAGFFIVLSKWMSALVPFMTADSFSNSYGSYLYPYSMFLDSFRFDSSWIPILAACGVIYLAGTVILYIKTIAYSMTAFILTDNPFIGYNRALKLSMAMTDGHKWRIFVLYLSFIGWGLLAILTFGIGYIFLAPYVCATQAQLYVRLRDDAVNSGLTTARELNVYPK